MLNAALAIKFFKMPTADTNSCKFFMYFNTTLLLWQTIADMLQTFSCLFIEMVDDQDIKRRHHGCGLLPTKIKKNVKKKIKCDKKFTVSKD